MAELNLGNKFECYNCGTRFYDLGKPESICPKCGANQKDSDRADSSATTTAAKRRRKVDVPKPVEVEEEVAIDEIPEEDLAEAGIAAELGEEEEEEEIDEET